MRSAAILALAMGNAFAAAQGGNFTVTPPPATATVTNNIGSVTTETIVSTVTAVPHDLIIICYGDFCAPEHHCPVCPKWQVVCRDGSCCPEECHGDDWDKVVICEGDKCHYSEGNCDQKIVCHGEECIWEEKHEGGPKKFVCHGDECCHEPCKGEECGKKEVCFGEKCEIVPPCEGELCPKPPVTPVKPPVKPPVVHEGCTGEECHVKPWVPSGCTGEECKPVETPIVSGAGQKVIAGFAAIIAGAVFVL